MDTVIVAKALAILDLGVMAAFGFQAVRLRRKRRHLQRIAPPDQLLYRVLGLVSVSALLSLLIGYSVAGLMPF